MTSYVGLRPSQPSALSSLLTDAGAKHIQDSLPLEVLHNLRYQHEWTQLRLETLNSGLATGTSAPSALDLNSRAPTLNRSRSPSRTFSIQSLKLVTGHPPRHFYLHPDFQAHLVNGEISPDEFPIQREWVLPMSTGERWTLRQFVELFDCLPTRSPLIIGAKKHQDAKRVLMAMLSHSGMGGDGTIVYYIMQEGDVKPRQN